MIAKWSELLSVYVGGMERNALAFIERADTEATLMFDRPFGGFNDESSEYRALGFILAAVDERSIRLTIKVAGVDLPSLPTEVFRRPNVIVEVDI